MEVLYLVIFQAITKCIAYDLEIEGMMRVGDEFLKKLNEDSHGFRIVDTTSHPQIKSIRLMEIYTGALKEAKKSRKTGEGVKMNSTYIDSIVRSLNRMKSDGLLRLKKLQVIVNKNLKLQQNISKLILKASDEFSASLDKYLSFVTGYVGNTELDVEFLILDLVETSNKILYSVQRRIFNEVVDKNEGKILKADINEGTEIIFKQNVNDKRKQMGLICEEHKLCRPFPGFTDYFADLISEVLKLQDDRLQIFLKILEKGLNSHTDFIHHITNERVLRKLCYHFSKLSTDVGIIRDIISVLRTVMTQRHKIIDTQDVKLKNRTAAIKILLDMIDKAFDYEGEEMVVMNIDIVVEAMRHWTSRPEDIESIVTNFLKYFFNILNQGIGDDAKKEMKILTEVILTGKSKNKSIFKYLLTTGSKFVRGEDLHIYSNFL